MKQVASFYYRRLIEECLPSNLNDVHHIFEESSFKIGVLKKNPVELSDQEVFQILALIDSNIVGSEIHIPIQLFIRGEIYYSLTGHALSVCGDYRGLGLGSSLTDQRLNYSRTNSLLLCDASQMHLPILERLGAHIFYMPRLIFLKRSIRVLESKLNNIFAKPISIVVDLFLKMQNCILVYLKNNILSRGFIVQNVKDIPESVEAILNVDKHPYKEIATKEWFQWVKNNTLIAKDTVRKCFYMIYKDGLPVGFYMTRERFYKQASHRGFKNITLGSILDWATIDENLISNNEVALLAITSFGKQVDAVELCCDTEQMASYFKRRGLVQIGSGNIVFRYRPNSVFAKIEDIGDPRKWRLRPSMGDNALS